ncbi:hypothetical protein BK742_25845 [Bacillus thuringiensis serovar pingluonsis]|uniref:Uncharacterized protein n=1 Tax=Bacillus thuringiensis serovar pingluonsis TaxID=180881 RepID=A0A243B0C7_BACTU|nr:hypothetical protein BK742_25845 [Bacillus thuringiensis serovar pingluonsis]
MIFYKKINDSGNVWAFNMTYFFIIFILKRKGIICIFIQIYKFLLYLLFNPLLKIQKKHLHSMLFNQLNNPFPNRT